MIAVLCVGLLSACSKAPQPAGSACKENAECEEGLVCLSGSCTAVIKKPELKKPTAEIIGPTKVKVGTKVRLDGTRSVGYQGSIDTYTWELTPPSGSKATLADANASIAEFTADEAGKYTVTLKVKSKWDDQEQESEVATVEVEAFKDNVPPEAKVDPAEASVKAGDKVSLDGSTSTDADGDKLTYTWSLVSKPDKSSATASGSSEKLEFTTDEGGLYVIQLLVDDGNGGKATAQAYITATVDPPAPALTSVTPNSGSIGAKVEMTIVGENMVYGLKATIDGKDFTKVQYVNDKKLTAWVDLDGWAEGKYKIKVTNPDSKESNEIEFEVIKPGEPTITYVGPALVVTGQNVRLRVEGTNFVEGAVVKFDGKELPTTFESDKALYGQLLVPTDGEYDVTVTNPDKQESKAYKFKVSAVVPIIDRIGFAAIGNDCASETLDIWGRNLLPGVSVELVEKNPAQGQTAKTFKAAKLTYVSMTHVKAEFDFTKPPKGDYEVVVTNAGSDAKDQKDFAVVDPIPAPAIASFTPMRAMIGGKLTGYIAGAHLNGATVTVNGKAVSLTMINRSTFSYPLDLAGATAGKTKVEVSGLCGKKADDQEIDVIAVPTPKITNLDPTIVKLGNKDAVSVRGEGFHPQAKVLADGMEIQGTTYINNALITIPATATTKHGKVKIVIENPGGLKSPEVELDINHTPTIESYEPTELIAGTTTGDLTLKGYNFVQGVTVTINGTKSQGAAFKSETEITIPLKEFTTKGKYKIIVENPANNLKSKEFEVSAYGKDEMVITKVDWSGNLYIYGINTRVGADYDENTDIVIYDSTGKQVYRKTMINSGIYIALYLGSSDFTSYTGSGYTMKLCRDINSVETCTPTVPFEYNKDYPAGGGGTTPVATPKIPPFVSYIAPANATTFVVDKTKLPTTMDIVIKGLNFEDKAKIWVGGKDITQVTGVKVTYSEKSITVEGIPYADFSLNDDTVVQVETSVNKSNSYPVHVADAQRIRVVWFEQLTHLNSGTMYFDVYGHGLTTDSIVYTGTTKIERDTTSTNKTFWSSSSSDAPSYLYATYTWDGELDRTQSPPTKVQPGVLPLRLETPAGQASNAVPLRTTVTGAWGTEQLAIKGIDNNADVSRDNYNLGGVAPYEAEGTNLRIAFTGFVAVGGGLSGKGKVLVDGQALTEFTEADSKTHFVNGYGYVVLKKQPIPGNSRVVSLQLENPDGKKSAPSFVTIMPKGSMRLKRIYDAYKYSNILRPGTTQTLRIYGEDIKGAKFYFAGQEAEVTNYYTYTYTSSTSGYSYEYVDVEINVPQLPDGKYPIWARKGSEITNTVLVNVHKEQSVGGSARLFVMTPAITTKAAATKAGNKVRMALQGYGFSSTDKLVVGGQKFNLTLAPGLNGAYADIDTTNLAKGKHKLHVESADGKTKSLEYQFELD
ncbi:MAG: hypothetical protein CL920_12625 [Deltaproteobacteria bacterium]|nr:hypothetical protein [Deltaproteobacteria bacterium]